MPTTDAPTDARDRPFPRPAVPAATATLSRSACPACGSRGPHLVVKTFDDEFTLLRFDCDWAWSVAHPAAHPGPSPADEAAGGPTPTRADPNDPRACGSTRRARSGGRDPDGGAPGRCPRARLPASHVPDRGIATTSRHAFLGTAGTCAWWECGRSRTA